MKVESIVIRAWDTSGSNSWRNPATLNTYLNNTYYNDDAKLSVGSKTLIQEYSWNVGAVSTGTTLANQISAEKRTKRTGNIGLISTSDAIRANTNINQCGTLNLNKQNSSICASTNYIIPKSSSSFWTISPYSSSAAAFRVSSDGTVSNLSVTNAYRSAHPALYLIPNITLSGKGTIDEPYTINS